METGNDAFYGSVFNIKKLPTFYIVQQKKILEEWFSTTSPWTTSSPQPFIQSSLKKSNLRVKVE